MKIPLSTLTIRHILRVPLAAAALSCAFTADAAPNSTLPPELAALTSRIKAAAPTAMSTDATAAKKGLAQLARISAELRAYAKANGLQVTSTMHTRPRASRATEQQPCPAATMNTAGQLRTLRKTVVGANGSLQCDYDCITIPPGAKPPAKAVWVPQGARQTGSHLR